MLSAESFLERQGDFQEGVRIEALVLPPGQRLNIFSESDPNVKALPPGEYLDEEKKYLTELFARVYYGNDGKKVEE